MREEEERGHTTNQVDVNLCLCDVLLTSIGHATCRSDLWVLSPLFRAISP